jgi:hypothetical protein
MIFPNNALTLKLVGYTDENFIIQLNTFDALTEVNSRELPDIKVLQFNK